MKKVLSVLSAFIMIFAVMPLSAFTAVAYTSGRYTYNITNDEVTITDVNTSISGDVTIPSKLGGYPVTVIDSYAFEQCSNITSVTIPDCVISIGAGAFYKCKNLTAVTIGGSVIKIGDGAFDECDSLESVTIPNSVKIIGNFAFSFCKSLATVTIPDSFTSIGNGAFESCSSLTSVAIPESITNIAYKEFYNCDSLESVIIPESVTSIGDCAFDNCSSLATVKIPDSVTTLGDRAFHGCSSLNEITLPDSLKSIGSEAFDFTGYYENKENWENGVLYCGKYLINVESDISGDYAIKDETSVVAKGTFCGCENLTSVTIPNSVTNIGDFAFYNCGNLNMVKIPNSVTSIGDFAFIGCENLTIYCYSGSVAEKYAQENDIPFVAFRLTGISIKTLPNKLRYYVRSSSLDTTGLTLLLTYSDDTTETVTSGYTISEFNADTTGEKTLTVTYKDLTTAFTVTVFCDHRMGHDVAAEESTCTTHGHGAYTVCDECGEIISGSDEELPLKAHNTYIKDYKAATCGAAGYTGNTVCKTCNTVVKKGTTIAATGKHKTSTIITPATTSANGKVEYKCSVCKKSVVKTIAKIKTITIPSTSCVYSGGYKKPTVTVKASSGRVLKYGTDYTVTYKNNKYVGTATVTVTFKGYYKGSKNLYFKIVPQSTSLSKLSASKTQLNVSWKKNSTVTGYQIQYSTSKSFTNAKTVTVKSNKTTSVTLSRLAYKKTYYVRVRTYKTLNGKYSYSSWSAYKYCKTK